MEIIEFLLFLIVIFVIFALTLYRKGILFAILGIVLTIFTLPYACFGLVVYRVSYFNSTSNTVETTTITANPSIMVLLFIAIALLFYMSSLWIYEEHKKEKSK